MKEILLVLMETLVHQKKKFSINFSKANTKYCLSLHYNDDNSYLFVKRKEIFNFKADNKKLTFQLNFVWEVFLMDLVLMSLEKYLYMEICMIIIII